jgi:cell division protease FtsH
MLTKNREKLDLIAETLLEVSIIDGEHFIKIMHENKIEHEKITIEEETIESNISEA